MNIVLLSGGSGKRLWPLSNDIRSKQFIRILTGEEGQAGTYSPQESIQIIIEGSGTYFDPDIVDVFVKIRNQLRHSRTAKS